jgi:hypothetical protein
VGRFVVGVAWSGVVYGWCSLEWCGLWLAQLGVVWFVFGVAWSGAVCGWRSLEWRGLWLA